MEIQNISRQVEHSNNFKDDVKIKRVHGKDSVVPEDKDELTTASENDVLIGDLLVDREAVIEKPKNHTRLGEHFIVVRMDSEDEARRLYDLLMNEKNRRRLERLAEGRTVQHIPVGEVEEFEVKGWRER